MCDGGASRLATRLRGGCELRGDCEPCGAYVPRGACANIVGLTM